MGKLDFIYNRRSIRQFTDEKIPTENLREIIKAATMAPSGKNSQTWHFVVVTNPAKIAELAEIVVRKIHQMATFYAEKEQGQKFINYATRYHTVFRNAPVIILVYAGPYPSLASELEKDGIISSDELDFLNIPNPSVQNAAAAMENLLLAATAMGYGTCWMTGLTYAGREISAYLGFEKPGYHLVAATPLGVPAKTSGGNPPRKPLDEIMTIIG
ncbi:MAG: nox [Firmicutes bacterium]|nr:nox [Bacillota bacterium]